MTIEIEVCNLTHGFETNGQAVTLLQDVNARFAAGKSTAIMGASGCGKSTLLTILAGFDKPNSGALRYIDKSSDDKRIMLRAARQRMSFVFQQYHLLPEFNTLQNIAFPLQLRGDREALDKARFWLEKVGMDKKESQAVSNLSGGEQQRVAIARAFVTSPDILFADEPTGSLDIETGQLIQELIFDFCARSNTTTIVVTHNEELANKADCRLSLVHSNLVASS